MHQSSETAGREKTAMLLQSPAAPHICGATCGSVVDTPMNKRTSQWRLVVALLFSLTLALTP
ncbi:MAG TPA: hypothetical protein VN900_17685, partial [Stellaceae bacterium]|nr:hypothetical protein [Stellaceae bacterium]